MTHEAGGASEMDGRPPRQRDGEEVEMEVEMEGGGGEE